MGLENGNSVWTFRERGMARQVIKSGQVIKFAEVVQRQSGHFQMRSGKRGNEPMVLPRDPLDATQRDVLASGDINSFNQHPESKFL